MKYRLFWFPVIIALSSVAWVMAQGPTGGGSVIRDITGGAALIFSPQNPAKHLGPTGGGSVPSTRKPPVRPQDAIIARANAARSAPQPRYAEAEQQYKLAAQIAPDDARAFAGLGNVYVDQGSLSGSPQAAVRWYAQAADAYQKARELNPNYDGVYLPLAFSLAQQGKYPEAIAVYQQALQREPKSPLIHNNLSYAYNHSERYQEAVNMSRQAIKLLAEDGPYKIESQSRNEIQSYAYKNLGNAFNGLKLYDDAANALKKSTEIDPKNVAAHFNLGLALQNAGRYPEAIESYKEAIKLRPSLAEAYFQLGYTYYLIKNKTAAMAQYETLKGLDAEMAKELYEAIKR